VRRLLAGALGVLLVGGLAGCGIPDNGEIEVDGSVPSAVSGSSDGRRDEAPSRTASGSDPAAFIRNYLAAAAGEPDRAYTRVQKFIGQEGMARLQVKQGSEVALTVVRLTERAVVTPNNNGTTTVKITVQQIGVLRTNGMLVPPVATEKEYKFTLRAAAETAGPGLFLTDPPNVLLLSDDALRQYYRTNTIYFWNSDQTRLVPDQRYLSLAVPEERRVSEVVRWLTGGPSDWLAQGGVTRLPDQTQLINNATGADGRWEVNLAMPGDNLVKLARLGTQLAWSLTELDGQLELKIQNQRRTVVDLEKERLTHPVYPIGDSPQRFCVYDGAIHPLSFAGEPSGTVPLAPAVNKGVVSAALTRSPDGILAALVMAGADGRHRLAVGAGADPISSLAPSASTYASMGRPVWLRTANPARAYGLVVADRKLYRFDERAELIQVPLSVPGPVSAVAASLDGYRMAVVIDGALHVAAVNLDGGVVTVGPARRLVTSLTDLSAVDWDGEDRLALAGSAAGRPAVYEISVDGALQTPISEDIGARVTHLAAYPTNPVGRLSTGAVMYEANGVAYRSGPVDTIKRDQVLEVPQPAAGVRPGNPTAPFFLY
jgi:hypothetical protein